MSMTTPICDFVRHYAESNALRLHVPGHKGSGFLGVEQWDITEFVGADSLYEAEGIIRESEDNASALFGAPTFYSTEGSSQCIRAMVYLVALHAKKQGKRPLILAGRNAHKTFLSAVALLDVDIAWMLPKEGESYLSCKVSAEDVETRLYDMAEKPAAVYLTSPDYLGNVADVAAIAAVCHRHDVLLVVDNAHGAYLKFLQSSRHPMDLGADICCDSAHKTFPVLTGGAYLHVREAFAPQCKNALQLFGSTSPSYLIMQSLDRANVYLADGYREKLAAFAEKVQEMKERLTAQGYTLQGDEPLKMTIAAKGYGYTGEELAAVLLEKNIVCEFADRDFVVLMLTPEIGEEGLHRLEEVLCAVPKRAAIEALPPAFHACTAVMSVREAMLSPSETVNVEESVGRVLAAAAVGCPPAVPIVVCGERIDAEAAACFAYYGIKTCAVVAQ